MFAGFARRTFQTGFKLGNALVELRDLFRRCLYLFPQFAGNPKILPNSEADFYVSNRFRH